MWSPILEFELCDVCRISLLLFSFVVCVFCPTTDHVQQTRRLPAAALGKPLQSSRISWYAS